MVNQEPQENQESQKTYRIDFIGAPDGSQGITVSCDVIHFCDIPAVFVDGTFVSIWAMKLYRIVMIHKEDGRKSVWLMQEEKDMADLPLCPNELAEIIWETKELVKS